MILCPLEGNMLQVYFRYNMVTAFGAIWYYRDHQLSYLRFTSYFKLVARFGSHRFLYESVQNTSLDMHTTRICTKSLSFIVQVSLPTCARKPKNSLEKCQFSVSRTVNNSHLHTFYIHGHKWPHVTTSTSPHFHSAHLHIVPICTPQSVAPLTSTLQVQWIHTQYIHTWRYTSLTILCTIHILWVTISENIKYLNPVNTIHRTKLNLSNLAGKGLSRLQKTVIR